MTILLTITLGILYFCGINLLFQRSLMRTLIGLLILSNAINLLIFVSGGAKRGVPAFIKGNATQLSGNYADPLPQALILTAIVIGFGIFAFYLVLTLKTYKALHSDDEAEIKEEI